MAGLVFLLWTASAFSPVFGVEITSGFSFNRVSFTNPDVSTPPPDYGLFSADFSGINSTPGGGSLGFLNVSTAAGWVIQNLPVDISSGLPGMAVLFDLPQSGGLLNADVDFSPNPTPNFAGLPGANSYNLGSVESNGEGLGAPVTSIGAPPAVGGPGTFLGSGFELQWQPGHVTLEEDVNQCGPGSVARSLTYLKNRYGVPVPDPNNPGTGTDNTPDSLVAKLDKTFVDKNGAPKGGRPKGARFGYDQLMNGKLNYLSSVGITGLTLKHNRITAGNTPIPAGNYAATGGLTSTDQTNQPVLQWLLGEIRAGEDVEMVYANAHVVEIVGGGTVLGRTWIAIQDDSAQGKPGGTSFLSGGLRFTWLDPAAGGGVNASTLAKLNNRNDLNLLVSESVPEPSPALLLALGLIGIFVGRMARRRHINL